MKRITSSARIRLSILLVATMVLLFDTFSFYRLQFLESRTTDQFGETPLTQLLQTQPTSEVPPKLAATTRVVAFNQLRTVDASGIESAQKSFTGEPAPTAVSQVLIYQLDYQILGRDGNWKSITAEVYLPSFSSEKKYPVFVFGSGTTGMADKCAPSLENLAEENIGNYENQMIAQAAAGFVAVFPDYEGFHDADATQAYFVSESEAKVLLGAISSLQELQSDTLILQEADFQNVFLAGYSQGGHAALSAAAQWQQLPRSAQLRGVIQYAGAADVQALFIESPWLASYLVDSYVQYYGSQLESSSVLQDRWLQTMKKNNELLCVNAAYSYYPRIPSEVYAPAFLDAIETNTWPENLAAWQKVIQLNTPHSQLPDVPYLSIQGAVDPIVTAQTQVANVDELCQQHKNITYREYAGVNHFQIRQKSFNYSNDWMKEVLAGRPLPNNCP